MIVLDQVSYQVGSLPILKNISTAIEKGGITALVGPNGAGKSTLLSLMARLLPLKTGNISFDGIDLSKTPTCDIAKKLAIMRQDNSVTSRITVRELLMFGRFPYHKGNPCQEDLEIIEKTLQQFNLLELASRFVVDLSGGQRQRTLVAMVFCQSTDYLLLDEPLNNLDMFHARNLMSLLRRIADEHNRTIIIVLHDINYASAYADNIMGMKNGELVLHGRPNDVITPQNLQRLFGVEAEIVPVQNHKLVMHYV
ncbi:MAG: ATP-binding cassette domain-containing protein [Advenella sp.]|nr:ATP-binding cassette domain-containing protein [Advenella sp.]